MNKSDLEKLSKSQLIKLLLKQNAKPIQRPISKPRKSVKQMVQEYENNIIIPAPRTKKYL